MRVYAKVIPNISKLAVVDSAIFRRGSMQNCRCPKCDVDLIVASIDNDILECPKCHRQWHVPVDDYKIVEHHLKPRLDPKEIPF